MAALSKFATTFGNATEKGCCGIISEKSDAVDGAVCHENSFADSGNLTRIEVDGAILCLVKNRTCLEYQWTASEINSQVNSSTATAYSSLDTCLAGGGYTLSDMCNEQELEEQVL